MGLQTGRLDAGLPLAPRAGFAYFGETVVSCGQRGVAQHLGINVERRAKTLNTQMSIPFTAEHDHHAATVLHCSKLAQVRRGANWAKSLDTVL